MRNLLLILILCVPGIASAAEVNVFTAASLREVVNEASVRFERQHPEHRVLVNAAASGILARQIESGAPADLFISANPQWMDYLVSVDRVAADGPSIWAANHLVVVGRGKVLTDVRELESFSRLAIASPESAPAGRYAQALLETAGLFRQLVDSQRLVLAKDVRQALLYAEQGVVDGAIVYASDARLAQKAKILLTPGADLQPEVRYPLALTDKGEASPAAQAFIALLVSAEGTRLLETYGLVPSSGGGE